MKDITVPEEWTPFISSNFNRIFINPASGCRANCVYCYIFDYGHPHGHHFFNDSVAAVRNWLQSNPGFLAGENGTLISIGSSCDPFDKNVTGKTLELVGALSPLQNPIQISTKYHVDQGVAEQLGKCQQKAGQIVLFATVTSFRLWEKIEPATDEPCKRLLGLQNAREQGITTCLYIKPILADITENEIPSFAQAVREYNIPYCTLGLIYTSDSLVSRMKKRGLPTARLEGAHTTIYSPPPSKANETQIYVLVTEMLDVAERIKSGLEAAGAECVISTPCVNALAYNILCPTGVWRYYEKLCVHCRVNCPDRLAQSSNRIKEIFV